MGKSRYEAVGEYQRAMFPWVKQDAVNHQSAHSTGLQGSRLPDHRFDENFTTQNSVTTSKRHLPNDAAKIHYIKSRKNNTNGSGDQFGQDPFCAQICKMGQVGEPSIIYIYTASHTTRWGEHDFAMVFHHSELHNHFKTALPQLPCQSTLYEE